MANKKAIDTKAVRHIARLSRLELQEKELGLYQAQLTAILGYIDKLREVDTADTPPTSHPLDSLKNVFRKDVVKKSLSVEEVLQNAPKKENSFFSVPKIIE